MTADVDLIVIGAGLSGGLPAAAYLQKAGLQVLVVEANAESGTFCYTHETWPQVLDSPHVGVSPGRTPGARTRGRRCPGSTSAAAGCTPECPVSSAPACWQPGRCWPTSDPRAGKNCPAGPVSGRAGARDRRGSCRSRALGSGLAGEGWVIRRGGR